MAARVDGGISENTVTIKGGEGDDIINPNTFPFANADFDDNDFENFFGGPGNDYIWAGNHEYGDL